jgi:uncharacterized protein YhbP (UPF0306 family)
MIDFDLEDSGQVARFVAGQLPRHKQFVLATVDELGKPWVVALNLTIDEQCNVIRQSKKDTEHSQHIRHNPIVAISIFSETEEVGDFGFYAKAVAREVTDESEVAKLLHLRFARQNRPVPHVSDYIGQADYRLYHAQLQEAWVNEERHRKTPVDLPLLKRALTKVQI